MQNPAGALECLKMPASEARKIEVRGNNNTRTLMVHWKKKKERCDKWIWDVAMLIKQNRKSVLEVWRGSP